MTENSAGAPSGGEDRMTENSADVPSGGGEDRMTGNPTADMSSGGEDTAGNGGDTAGNTTVDVPFGERLAGFYSPAVSLNRLRPRPDAAAAPADLLLRILEPPQVKVRHIPLVDVLRKPYRELNDE